MIKLTKEQEAKYKREKRILDNRELWWACDIIENKFDQSVLSSVFNNNMTEKDIIKYAEILYDNKKAPKIDTLKGKIKKNKMFVNYNNLEAVQKILEKEMKLMLPLNVIIEEIKCKQGTKNNIGQGNGELFIYNNFQHDNKNGGGDFYFNNVKYEIKINEGRLRGSKGFNSLISVRQSILDFLEHGKYNKEVRDLYIKNKKDKQGHLKFFPLKKKRKEQTVYLLPEINKHLNKQEQIKFQNFIVESFSDYLYIIIKNYNSLTIKLKKVVDTMLKGNIDKIDDEWKNLNLEYYWEVEDRPCFIIFDNKKDSYKGIFISNDIEEVKKHTKIELYPTSKTTASAFDAVFGIGYKE